MASAGKFDAKSAAQALRAAMAGWGTNDSALVQVIGNLDVQNIKALRAAYKDLGRDLIADIKDETSGSFEDALVAALTPLIEYDCSLLRKAMKGLGTDEEVLIEVLLTRLPAEINAINADFKELYAHDLQEDIQDECGGYLKNLLLQRLKGDDGKGDLDRDVEKLYEAGQGKLGTDEAVFVNILSHRSRDYIAKLNVAYANKHGKSLATVVQSEVGGEFKKALLALVTPGPEYFADKLAQAFKGAGTDDTTVIRVICSQRGRWLKDIANVFLQKNGESLKKRIGDECGGDYKKLLISIIEHYVEGKK
jgi:annexin A7/11